MTQKILLIEGDPQAREDFASGLRDHHFAVSTAKDGPTGIRVFEKIQPDLVISNLILGDMTAVEICEKIRNTPKGFQTRIILVSNTQRSTKYIEGITSKYNLTTFLQKPFSAQELLNVVQEILGKNGASPPPVSPRAGAPGFSAPKDRKARYFPGMILQLCSAQATGSLALKKEKHEKTLYFEKGKIVGVESNVQVEQMGKLLVQKGVILEKDYLRAAQMILEEGIQMGEALLRLKCLEKPVLDDLIAEHQVTKVANSFLWIDAEIDFRPLDKLPELKNYGSISLDKVFNQGIEVLRNTPNIGKVLMPIKDEFVGLSPEFEKNRNLFRLTAQEQALVPQINSAYRLDEILIPAYEPFLAMVYLSGFLISVAPDLELLKKRLDSMKSTKGPNQETIISELAETKSQLEKIKTEKKQWKEKVEALTQNNKQLEKSLQETQSNLQQQEKELSNRSAELEELMKEQKKSSASAAEKEKWEKQRKMLEEEKETLQEQIEGLAAKAQQYEEQLASTSQVDSGNILQELEPLDPVEPMTAQTPAAPAELDSLASFPADFAPEFAQDFFSDSPIPPETTPTSQEPYLNELASELTSQSAFVTGEMPQFEAPPFAELPQAETVEMYSPEPPAIATPADNGLDIFDLAADLEGAPSALGQTSPVETTLMYASPKSLSTPEEKDSEIDQALDFMSAANTSEEMPAHETPAVAEVQDLSKAMETLEQTSFVSEAAPPQLPLDPFAPTDIRTETTPVPAAPKSAPEDPFEEFFKVSKK